MPNESKNKNVKIPKKVEDDLIGFEEVLDLLDENKSKKKGVVAKDNQNDSYELYHFLEQEHQRLKRLHEFWNEQYPSLIKNEKIEWLIAHQKDVNHELREQIVTKLMPAHSPFHTQMKYIWDRNMVKE